MSSLLLATLGYFLAALVFVLDKYILKSRIPHPGAYAFFVGLFGMFVLGFAPFGWGFFGWEITALSMLAGFLFVYGLVGLYNAIALGEIARVAPLVGSMTTAIVLIFALFGWIVANENLGMREVVAVLCLVLGGILLSIRMPFSSKIFFRGFGYALLAALLFALFFMGFKAVSQHQNFVSALIWSRLGMALGALSLLLIPTFRREILSAFTAQEKNEKRKRRWTTALVFVLNKSLGGISYLCIGFAITLGSVTIVQALGSIQYAFVIVLGAVATVFFPQVFSEGIHRRFGIQMAVALALIATGTVLAAMGGRAVI